jgi:hypothetical protein
MQTFWKLMIFLVFINTIAIAQNGFIRGTVYDAMNGEAIPGVTVFLEGTKLGAMTDLDGKFNITVPPGTYQVRVSFISYNTLSIDDVKVKEDEVVVLDNLKLKEATLEISTVTITAQQTRNTESAMQAMKKMSANVMDGISAVTFKKIGDSDAASSMKRVSGVSVSGGKYIFVRGLGDRYTKTILNGVDIPGLDPDRNTIQMDIFPTNIIDNIIVHKSFSADLPADFSGGVIDIGTKDFPEEKVSSLSLGLAYNPLFHFNSNYLTYDGGKTDFLGFDDGTRAIPATEDIPQFAQVVGKPNSEIGQRYIDILESFNKNLAAYNKTSFMDYNFGFNFGNQKVKETYSLGYNYAFSYKNETEFYKNAIFARYGLDANPEVNELDQREYQAGSYGTNNVLLSGMAGLAVKTQLSKIRFNLLHLQNGESKAGIFDYEGSDQGSNFVAFQHSLDYSQRSLSNLLIDGKHTFNDSKWDVLWKVSPTFSKMADPDIRFTRYQIREGSYVISTESGFPERIWRNLQEWNMAGVVHLTHNFRIRGEKAKLNFGGGYTYKNRDFFNP